jgi:murein DD-endopeptidase MepM/ murein hydrolase activator NlpD
MTFPIDQNRCPGIPINYHPGAFGYKRKWNYHPGVDLYVQDGEPVYAIEDGMVVSTGLFTGPEIDMPWWETTWYVMVEGKTGVFNYGEIRDNGWRVGDRVMCGTKISYVKKVLFDDKFRAKIPGHSTSMLHLELYTHGTTEPVEWLDKKPPNLLDPTFAIWSLWPKDKPMINFQWD